MDGHKISPPLGGYHIVYQHCTGHQTTILWEISSRKRAAIHWDWSDQVLDSFVQLLKFFLVTVPQMSISIVSHILSLELVVFSVAEKTFVVLFFCCITCNNSQARWLPTLKWVAKWFSNNWHHTDQQWHNNTHRATLHTTCSICIILTKRWEFNVYLNTL